MTLGKRDAIHYALRVALRTGMKGTTSKGWVLGIPTCSGSRSRIDGTLLPNGRSQRFLHLCHADPLPPVGLDQT